MKSFLRFVYVACVAILFSGYAVAQQPVAPPPRPANDAPANTEILKLLTAGMPESVVLVKICAISDKFDTSADALVTLKQAGATEAELKAIMVQGAAPTQPVEQPPVAAPADSGPSLAETMQFIQNKLNDLGKETFALYIQDSSDNSTAVVNITSEINNVVADQSQCRITYHLKISNNNKVKTDLNGVCPLRDVGQIVVRPYEYWQTEWFAKNGFPTATATSTNPPAIQLSVHHPHGEENFFYFTDADLADRMAKAFTHAVELCGGGNQDKF